MSQILMQVRKMDSLGPLAEMKRAYVQQATAPLDGMWLCGLVPQASHFGLYQDEALAGYFCVNDEGDLLQFFVSRSFQGQSSQLFERISRPADSPAGRIRGAFVSTAEPHYLSLCLDRFSTFEVNALMYQHQGFVGEGSPAHALEMPAVEPAQHALAVDFVTATMGDPVEWTRGYLGNLIERRELYGLWKQGRLVAIGESRRFDEHQTQYADLGVIVAESERGRGMATRILKQLVAMNEIAGLKSICSTTRTNLAAQKAIGRAGFFASHRILQFRA